MTKAGDIIKPKFRSGCTRPGKFRLPDSTATGLPLPFSIIFRIGSVNEPELPMQVVHPNPTMPNPIASRSSSKPERFKYEAAVGEPGANDVLTQCAGLRPKARAFRATRPAAIRSPGSEVFVQLVIDAIAIGCCGNSEADVVAFNPNFCNAAGTCAISRRSCGRVGPA